MKTLLITLDFPPLLGGIANYYYNQVNKMPHDKVVVLMNNTRQIAYDKQSFKIIYKNFFTRFIWPHWLPLIWHIYKIVKKEKIKMLWVGQVIPVGTAVWILSALLSFPRRRESIIHFFVTCHGNDLLRAKLHPRKYRLAKKILRDAEFVEANTNFTKNILINDFNINQNKIKVVYPECALSRNQVDENKVKKIKDKYNLHNKKVLLTVARLVKSKGIKQVIKALSQILPDRSDLVYLIIGDGADKQRLISLTADLPQIIFVGDVPNSQLSDYYAAADLFILTPIGVESFGIVYLEALAFGLPVIAGKTGGVKEIKNIIKTQQCYVSTSTDKFILVNSENIEEIKKNIVKLLNG